MTQDPLPPRHRWEPDDGRLTKPKDIVEVGCADCGALIQPTMNERGDVRCSSCRASHVASVIGARRAAAE